MNCIECGKPIPLPTADPFRCPNCRRPDAARGLMDLFVAAHRDAYLATTGAQAVAATKEETPCPQ